MSHESRDMETDSVYCGKKIQKTKTKNIPQSVQPKKIENKRSRKMERVKLIVKIRSSEATPGK